MLWQYCAISIVGVLWEVLWGYCGRCCRSIVGKLVLLCVTIPDGYCCKYCGKYCGKYCCKYCGKYCGRYCGSIVECVTQYQYCVMKQYLQQYQYCGKYCGKYCCKVLWRE